MSAVAAQPADDLPGVVCDALASGKLGTADLSARQLGAFLGKTTSVLYHHWGSLDGFLFAVSQHGVRKLGEHVVKKLGKGGDLSDMAAGFVSFGLDHPALYELMFERRYDWKALRESGAFTSESPGLGLFTSMTAFLAGAGSTDADGDARILFAGLHGLVSLALSGRANVGMLSRSDRELAVASARKLARRLLPHDPKKDPS
jgi:AcrR family transcriptional regulator